MGKDTAPGSDSLDSVQSLTRTSYMAKLSNSFNDLICEMGMITLTYLIGLLRGPKELMYVSFVSKSPGDVVIGSGSDLVDLNF